MKTFLIIFILLIALPCYGWMGLLTGGGVPVAGGSGSDAWVSVNSGDDTGRIGNSAWSTTTTSLRLGCEGGQNGRGVIRFPAVTVPQGATVTAATITGIIYTGDTAAYYTIRGIESDVAQANIDTEAHLDATTLTTATAAYGPINGTGWGEHTSQTLAADTVDFRAVLNEVFGSVGWSSGSDLGIEITGSDPDPGSNWTNRLIFRTWDYGDNTYVFTINISYTY
jgi:hypothetical protein